MTFGEKIQKLRKEKSMSQEELAEKLNVTRQTISKWELDQSTPELNYISQLSYIFGVTTDYLIKDGAEPDSKERMAKAEPEAAQVTPPWKSPDNTVASDGTAAGRASGSFGGSRPTGAGPSTAAVSIKPGKLSKKRKAPRIILAIILCLVAIYVIHAAIAIHHTVSSRTKGSGQSTESSAGLVSRSDAVRWSDARNYVGKTATFYGPVVMAKYASGSKGRPTFLDIGGSEESTSRLTVIIYEESRWNFSVAPETAYNQKNIYVTGTVKLYNGVPEIVVSGPSQIEVAS